MTNQNPAQRNQTSEGLHWLDIATRVLAGAIRPDEARHIFNLGSLYPEAAEAQSEPSPRSPARQ